MATSRGRRWPTSTTEQRGRPSVGAQGLSATGAPGGIYATDLFTSERGQATVFIGCTGQLRPVGRVEAVVVPPAELAVIVHRGPHDDIDRSYGALATHVTQHCPRGRGTHP